MLLTIFSTAACMSLGRSAFWEGSFLFLKSFLPRTRRFFFLRSYEAPLIAWAIVHIAAGVLRRLRMQAK